MPCPTLPRTLAAACVCLLGISWHAMADEVRLLNGGKLTGNVLSIQEGGAIQLESPLATKPLSLNGDAVEQVEFKRSELTPTTGNTRFELANQDFIIGKLLAYSPETGARIHADGIGELQLPLGSLRSISLDVQAARVIYHGPDELANWSVSDRRGAQNWQFNRQRLSVTGSGQIGRMLELPERYVIRAKLHWQGQPNFQMSFSDPLEESQTRVDRYYLQFGRAGLEIKRVTSTGKGYHTVCILPRTPDQFPNREIDIELRVDRTLALIHLAINGSHEGRFIDHHGNLPTAGGISLVSNASAGHQLDVSSLVVESWSEQTANLPTQKRDAVETRDTLMMREGDHFGGVIQSIREVDGGLRFAMKADFREKPIEVLGQDVAMVSFASAHGEGGGKQAASTADLVLKLHDRGRLSVTQSAFEDGRVRAAHPLLGDLMLSRSSVSSLERRHMDEKIPAKP